MSETVGTPHYTGVKMMDPTSTAGPIGLLAFGIATVLLSLVNAGYYPLDSMVVMMGAYVGFAMVITGYMEWRKGNSFGAAAFFTFGFFWLSFTGLLILPALKIAAAPSTDGDGRIPVHVGALRLRDVPRHAEIQPGAPVHLPGRGHSLRPAGAGISHREPRSSRRSGATWESSAGLAAVYTGFGQVLNEVYERTIVPLG